MKCKYVFLSLYILSFLYFIYKSAMTISNTNQTSGMYNTRNVFVMICFVLVVYSLLSIAVSILLMRSPMKGPQLGFPLFLSSLILAVSVVLSAYFVPIPSGMNGHFSQLLLNVVSAAYICFLVFYALQLFFDYKIPGLLHLIPLVFWLTKIITDYIKIAKMPFIPENGFKTVATALVVLFCLYFAKYQSRIISKNGHKLFIFTGFLAATMCESFAIPQLYIYFKKGYPVVNGVTIIRNHLFELVLYAVAGLFVMVYLHCAFSNNNLARHKHHSNDKHILPLGADKNADDTSSQ